MPVSFPSPRGAGAGSLLQSVYTRVEAKGEEGKSPVPVAFLRSVSSWERLDLEYSMVRRGESPASSLGDRAIGLGGAAPGLRAPKVALFLLLVGARGRFDSP
jgi:hypothetical protein